MRNKVSIEKFKTPDEATKALWCFKPDVKYFRQLRKFWKMANRFCPPNFPKGVFKYKTIEEAGKEKEIWIIKNAIRKNKTLI